MAWPTPSHKMVDGQLVPYDWEPDTQVEGKTLAQGTDSRLVQTKDGIVLTDKDGKRRQ